MAGRFCTQILHDALIFVFSHPSVTSVHEPRISRMGTPWVKTQKYNFYTGGGEKHTLFIHF